MVQQKPTCYEMPPNWVSGNPGCINHGRVNPVGLAQALGCVSKYKSNSNKWISVCLWFPLKPIETGPFTAKMGGVRPKTGTNSKTTASFC